MTDLLTRLPGLAALLLAFGMLAPVRAWPWLYRAQAVCVAVAAGMTAVSAAQAWPLLAVPVLLAQAAAIPRLVRGEAPRAIPAAMLAAGVAVAALAASLPVGESLAIPLAIVLLGLLAALAAPPRWGVLLLLNGAQAALCQPPADPAAPWAVATLALLAAIVASDGLPRWSALR